jgi:TPR repeat protein
MASADITDPVEAMVVADVLVHQAHRGNVCAQANIGRRFNNGRGVARNGWYARATQEDDAHAQDVLPWPLTDGDHRQPDYARKAALLRGRDGHLMPIGAEEPSP